MYIKNDMDFNDLMNNCWSGAINTLKTIKEHDKEKELIQYLEDICDDCPSLTHVNDLLWFNSDFILEALGIFEEDEEEDVNGGCVVPLF